MRLKEVVFLYKGLKVLIYGGSGEIRTAAFTL